MPRRSMFFGLGILALSAYSYSQAPLTGPVTGLKVLSAAIDPKPDNIPDPSGKIIKVRSLTVKVQNTTDKTIVGYAVVYHELDLNNHQVGSAEGAGMLADHNGPNNPSHTGFILPGQIGTITGYAVGPDTVSVEAVIVTVLFEDDSVEGAPNPAHMMFTSRRNAGKRYREQAAQETGAKKAELERKAEWFEAHTPKEANQ